MDESTQPAGSSPEQRRPQAPTVPLWPILLSWLAAALVIASTGLLTRSPLIPPVVMGTLLLGWLIACARSARLSASLQQVDLRWVVAIHVVRVFFGAVFLHDLGLGRLPALFALRAGPGDLAVGGMAGVLWVLWRRLGSSLRGLLLLWNVAGLADILLVVGTGQYLFLVIRDPLMPAALSHLPYSLLPTLVVPLILLTHMLVFRRLWEKASTG